MKHHNFCRLQQPLQETPAIHLGLADNVRELDELAALRQAQECAVIDIARNKQVNYRKPTMASS